MAVREILQIGHPILRRVAREVAADELATTEVQHLIDDLVDTMHDADGGGIAANQVGETLRICILEVDDNPRYPYKPSIPLTIAVNPVVETVGDATFTNNEGCLSVPLRGEVERHVDVRVRYLDRYGGEHDVVASGLEAGTWQHEVDHLDGVLFVDRVTDPSTLATWDEFTTHHREAFVERITAFVAEVAAR
ncbi:MAG: peptide deformylase [Actinobacteria bacterium]|nr:peptide deformylase [Actinomycetota bacterium]